MTLNAQGIVPVPAPSFGIKTEAKNVGNNNQNSRRDNNRRRNQGYNNHHYIPRMPKFKGPIPELKGHIYDAGYVLQANCFIMMTRELAKYTGRTCHNAGDICLAISKQENVVFKIPTLYPSLQVQDKKDIAPIIIAKE
eukprot:12798811-Ditylum_brightwellii.AAC.1